MTSVKIFKRLKVETLKLKVKNLASFLLKCIIDMLYDEMIYPVRSMACEFPNAFSSASSYQGFDYKFASITRPVLQV